MSTTDLEAARSAAAELLYQSCMVVTAAHHDDLQDAQIFLPLVANTLDPRTKLIRSFERIFAVVSEPAQLAGVSGSSMHVVAARLGRRVWQTAWCAVSSVYVRVQRVSGPEHQMPTDLKFDSMDYCWGAVRIALASRFPLFDWEAAVETVQSEHYRAAALAAQPTVGPGAMLSVTDLAARHRVDKERLRKRLERWRYEHDTGYIEVNGRRRRDPRYLYDERAVIDVIEELRSA